MKFNDINFKKLAWAFMTILFSISLILSVLTAHNYTEIAKARILADISTDVIPDLKYDSLGNLESVNMTVEFTIINPSQKALKVWILNYKGWLRDLPMEDGTDISRWMIDGKMTIGDTEQSYYPVFVASYSFDVPAIIVEPQSNTTITKYLELNQTVDPTIMETVVSIYNYSIANGHDIEWYDYSSAIIFIQDIPQYSGPNKDANVIRRFLGFDLTPGVGGVGR